MKIDEIVDALLDDVTEELPITKLEGEEEIRAFYRDRLNEILSNVKEKINERMWSNDRKVEKMEKLLKEHGITNF